MVNTKFEIILVKFFLKFNNTNILFDKKSLMYRFYTPIKALFTIGQVLIIHKKNFVIAALNMDSKTFIVYVKIQKQEKISINPKKATIKIQAKV